MESALPQPDDAVVAGVPQPEDDQQDRLSPQEQQRIAKDVAEKHRKALSARRYHDLTREKYLIHIDGEGDAQWADLHRGTKIAMPQGLSGVPLVQENQLRPIVDNAVAHHTTMPFQFLVDAKPDRASRESAVFDEALAHHLVQAQRLNAVFSEAMTLAMPFGSCPVHAFWRNDITSDPYEPLHATEFAGQTPQRGSIDAFVGDPWDTIYDAGTRRSSIYRVQYGRVLPADLVRKAFPHVKGLEGNDRLPSASRFQRIRRRWVQAGIDTHGTSAITQGEDGDELLPLICREIAPGLDPKFPQGRLTVIVLNGAASTDQSDMAGAVGRPVLLHDGPLPGGCFSMVSVYSAARFDDILGKPFAADLDDLQVQLNQALTDLNLYLRDAVTTPLIDPGIEDDTAYFGEHVRITMDPAASHMPQFLEHPMKQAQVLVQRCEDIRSAMFRIGGYQAASRGEAYSGQSGKSIIALQRADDTIHGPTNMRFRESVEDFMGIGWRLFKQYADVPWAIDIAGDDYAHLADAYIDRTKVSENPPRYRLVSGYGATPDAEADLLLGLVEKRGADGEPLMETPEFKKAFPGNRFSKKPDRAAVQEKRARYVAAQIRRVTGEVGEQMGDNMMKMFPMLVGALQKKYRPYPGDDPKKFVEVLDEIVLDETENPLTREVALKHQDPYRKWMAQLAMKQMAMRAQTGGPPKPGPGQRTPPGGGPRRLLRDPAKAGGTPTSESLDIASDKNPAPMGGMQ